MTRRQKRFSAGLTILLAITCLVLGLCIGVIVYGIRDARQYQSDKLPVSGELQIHFLELGNKYTGDCTYIKAGDVDILIDAGSRSSSIPVIAEYLNQYVDDGKLEYVIVTHAHEDHYAGFSVLEGSLFDLFECGTIIDFALTNQEDKGTANMYGRYLLEREEEVRRGAVHYTAAECIEDPENKNNFDLGNGIILQILDSRFYTETTDDENDYSVCTLLTYGDHNYLFTGDLEAAGEAALVERNELPQVDLYKAGHHGSKTSSSAALLDAIRPEIVCVCCCCGSPEYTKDVVNQFPTQAFIDRVAEYTDRVYVTTRCVDYENNQFESMNGNIIVMTDKGGVKVFCSNDNRILREWAWFAEWRTCPEKWKKAS